ncbi:MAG: tetratricopeptide repeat protein [Pseudomonadales bacterium]
MPTSPHRTVFQRDQSFSQSALWAQQRAFFAEQGVNAWAGPVPFYVTSNPYLANSYARVLLRFMQDWSHRPDYDPDEPFYLIELGSGSGRLGFYLIKQLLALQQQLGLETLHCVYVLTDFTQINIDYWRQHPAWHIYTDQGVVDFALFDVEHDTRIHLQQSGHVLGSGEDAHPPRNPCLFIANYLFDCLLHDVFLVRDQALYAATPILATDTANLDTAQQPIALDQVEVDFSYQHIDGTYYGIDAFDTVLQHYQAHLDDQHFILPIGGLRCLENLGTLSHQRYLMLAADKGDTELTELARATAPRISLHGNCFSMQVNFHALGRYVQACGGTAITSPTLPGLTAVAYVQGLALDTLPETRQALHCHGHTHNPIALYQLYRHIKATRDHCPLEALVSLLSLSGWDPHIFHWCITPILAQLDQATPRIRQSLARGLTQVVDNFYALPQTPNTLLEVGSAFYSLEDYATALQCYQQSLDQSTLSQACAHHQGDTDLLLHNIGLCYYFLDDYPQARHYFQQALDCNGELDTARQWLIQIETLAKNTTPQDANTSIHLAIARD